METEEEGVWVWETEESNKAERVGEREGEAPKVRDNEEVLVIDEV